MFNNAGTTEGEGLGGGGKGDLAPNFLDGEKIFYHLTISISKLRYILISILKFSLTNQNGRLDFNREIIAFQLLFLFSFVLESAVFHENEVSSLNKFEGAFAQRHSFMREEFYTVMTILDQPIPLL